MTTDRLVSTTPLSPEDDAPHIRPETLDTFLGQSHLKENLKVFIQAALTRGEALDHVLFYGPPGLGKTTLSHIISKELGVGFKSTSGPVIARAGDLAAILTNLKPNDVLFIDEIHRLNPAVEEILYPAMEDFKLDLVIGEGPAARNVKIDLPPFTLVGATTRSGLLTRPLRERFGIPLQLHFYSHEELTKIIMRLGHILNTQLDQGGAFEIARRSRGTPRIAVRLTKRVRDFAQVEGAPSISEEVARDALDKLAVDTYGLDPMDRRYLNLIAQTYEGGPVGADTIAAALSEEKDMLEDVIEPYLIQIGFLARTPRGRQLTAQVYDYLGLQEPTGNTSPSPKQDRFL